MRNIDFTAAVVPDGLRGNLSPKFVPVGPLPITGKNADDTVYTDKAMFQRPNCQPPFRLFDVSSGVTAGGAAAKTTAYSGSEQ